MLKKIIVLISILAFSCLNVSCAGKKSDTESFKKESKSQNWIADFPELYKDFFDYTFDGNYTIETQYDAVNYKGTENEQAYRSYLITYECKDGTERRKSLIVNEFTDEYRKVYDSERRMNNERLNEFCYNEMMNIAEKEFIEKILSKYLDVKYKEDIMFCEAEENDEFSCIVKTSYPINKVEIESDLYEKSCRVIDSNVAPETGLKLSEADLKTIANDKSCRFIVCIHVINDNDVQPYIDKMENTISEYFAYTGSPMNCTFLINKAPNGFSEDIETIYNRTFLMGKELSENEKEKYDTQDIWFTNGIDDEITRICLEE